jgi:hypothetical protein
MPLLLSIVTVVPSASLSMVASMQLRDRIGSGAGGNRLGPDRGFDQAIVSGIVATSTR